MERKEIEGPSMITIRVSHSRKLLTRVAPASAMLLQLAWSGVAHGQSQEDANAAETAAARGLAVEGVKLAQAGQCKEAVDKLDRAEKLRHSPIVLGHLGECQIQLGQWVEGSENLRKLLRDPLPPDPSAALEQTYQRATATLREIKPRIPAMIVNVKVPRDVDITLKVDGKEVPDTMIGVPLPADPGEHFLEVEARGFLKTTSAVRLEPGAKETVTLEPKRDPFATEAKPADLPPPTQAPTHVSPPPFATTAATPPSAESSSQASRILAYVSYGVGAVGLGVGIGFGRAAMQDENSLSSRCPDKICPPDAQSDLDSAKTKGVISTIGFGVGAAGVTLGTILLVTSSSSSSTNTGSAPARPAIRPTARIGLGRVVVGADF
jgi:hypothetical protein